MKRLLILFLLCSSLQAEEEKKEPYKRDESKFSAYQMRLQDRRTIALSLRRDLYLAKPPARFIGVHRIPGKPRSSVYPKQTLKYWTSSSYGY